MLRPARATALAIALVLAGTAARAQAPDPPVTARTFRLRHLQPDGAARLVSPYVTAREGGVFEAGGQTITVRETQEALARIEAVLREHDRPPATLVLRFQLIAAGDAGDAAPGGLDSTLRRLFSFRGYRLLSEGVATVGERDHFAFTMAAAEGDVLRIGGQVGPIDTQAERGSVHLRVGLERPSNERHQGAPVAGFDLLSTGVTVPLGQTVVLGSAVPGGKVQALILTVRPELASPR